MKFYKKMIRPMVAPPVLPGMNCQPYPLISDDYWIEEDYQDLLTDMWKEHVKHKDPWATLKVEEKYVEVELPKPTLIKIGDNNFVCFMVDTDKIDLNIACEYVEKYMEILPNEVGVAVLPSIEPKVLDKDTVDAFIDDYKRRVEEKYK